MARVDAQRNISATWRPTFYTFGAVFLSILVVGFAAVPWILGFAQRVYLDLASDVNQRQARSMTAFLESRLQAGLSEDEAILEFQAATAGSDVDRGYVCLIERGSSRYLSHPNLEKLGMDVKPGALFSPAGGQEAQAPWSTFIEREESSDGLLTFGPQMSEEMVYFTSVPGTGWTVSTHKNLDRVYEELGRLRRSLIGGAVLLSLLFALSASVAARGVSRRREAQIQRQAELERRLLEEEDARKSLELNQARELQLSLVPRELPRRPEVRMAARMETATEVGGDYYDVIEREDGSLLFALGDATGHGLKAGMMVVAAKSLFAYSANSEDLVDVAARMAKALRTMRLGRLHMAFALAHLTGRRLEVVGAGMPPALIHRHGTGSVEELALSGAPLGSPMDFPYSLARVDLEAGDTVLLMSDGLPELQSAEGEVLGYEGVEGFFSDAVEPGASPEDIVAALSQSVFAWSGRELEDDVTYLVLRVS